MRYLVPFLCLLLVTRHSLALPVKDANQGCPSLPQARCVAPMDCIGRGGAIYGRCVNQYGLCCSINTTTITTTTTQPTLLTVKTTNVEEDQFQEKYGIISLQEIYESILEDQEAKLEESKNANRDYILIKKTLLEHLIESEKKHTLQESLKEEDQVESQSQNVPEEDSMEFKMATDGEATNLEMDLEVDQPIITGDRHNYIPVEPEIIEELLVVEPDYSVVNDSRKNATEYDEVLTEQTVTAIDDDSTLSKSQTVVEQDDLNDAESNQLEDKPSNHISIPIEFFLKKPIKPLTSNEILDTTTKPVDAATIKTSQETHKYIYLNENVVPLDKEEYLLQEDHLQNLEEDGTKMEPMEPYHHSWESLNDAKTGEVCGRPMFPRPRVIGGTKVPQGAWPWKALLVVHYSDKDANMCGASLINREWLVTAAHCLDNVQPQSVSVRLGMTNYKGETESQTKMKLKQIIRHPKYNTRTLNYDLALIRLETPVQYSIRILPVCLPRDDHLFINDRGIVTGWGTTEENSDATAPHMLEGEVPILSNSQCEEMYLVKNIRENIAFHSVCAGYVDGRVDTCDGDSGGPLVSYRDNRWVLVGVSSWGTACGRSNEPGVYARVSEFREWIHQQIEI